MTRSDLFLRICESIGSLAITPIDANDGWPGTAWVNIDGAQRQIAMHVSKVSSHSRHAYEMRFQNPASRKPVQSPGGAIPILVGYYRNDNFEVLIACEGTSRVGRQARFSILFNRRIIDESIKTGWAMYESAVGEQIYAFLPPLFPTCVDLLASDVRSPTPAIQSIVAASGMLEDEDISSEERARRAAHVLVRDQAFSRKVRAAYGHSCAMCGLRFGLVVGAHIYPASAPGSTDRVQNGLALCQNHHTLFDAHRIWVQPKSRELELHPSIVGSEGESKSAKAFVQCTFASLADPISEELRPKPSAFKRRYDYFGDNYNWAG